jgi:hypothetical protein
MDILINLKPVNMNRLVALLFIHLSLIACNSELKETSYSASSLKADTSEPKQEKVFANPNIIFGSSFGAFFQSLYKLGKFEEMVLFTSKKTIDKYGKTKLKTMYQMLDFAFTLKLLNVNGTASDSVITQTYETTIMATTKIFQMQVIIENDTTKLVSCSLEGFPK